MTDAMRFPVALRPSRQQERRAWILRALPWIVIISYLLTTLVLFLVWPINWPIYFDSQWLLLIGYVLACFAAITFGYFNGAKRGGQRSADFRFVGAVILGGAILSTLLLFPSSYIYTGRWPWQVGGALGDQGEAYRALQYQLELTAGQRGPIALARALAAPLTFAVLPLGLIYWGRLGWTLRAAVGVTILNTIILSLLRGTDREFSDLFIVGVSALTVSLARQFDAGDRLAELVRRYWKVAVGVLLFVGIAASLSSERKNARLGGLEQAQQLCANNSNICADIDQPLLSVLPTSTRIGVSFFILSTCSGYYGLLLALEKDFQSTYGLGHSPASLAVYELVTGDTTLEGRTFTDRNGYDGWPDENYWSTLVTWLANDVGFAGAIPLLALIAFVWGRSWRDATAGNNDPAAIIFAQLMIVMFYLPANNQVYAIYDGYTVTLVWAVLWWLSQRRRAAAAG